MARHLETLTFPRSLAWAWWGVGGLVLVLLAAGDFVPHLAGRPWTEKASVGELSLITAGLVLFFPFLFALLFRQSLYLDDGALEIRLGRLEWVKRRILLSDIRECRVLTITTIGDLSHRETGGHGRGMTCFYTKGNRGFEIITSRKKYFVSSEKPEEICALLISA